MKNKIIQKIFIIAISLGIIAITIFAFRNNFFHSVKNTNTNKNTPTKFSKSFESDFSGSRVYEEINPIEASTDPHWWLNSGAYLYVDNGIARTIQGELSATDKWRLKYATTNPSETDEGYHPQNIFRLVQKEDWQNFQQENYFRIKNYIKSEDSRRSESNGILLFNRYLDGDNLYYTGLRVDGTAIIKKKQGGLYYTMAQKKIIRGDYDREKYPNLMPMGQWIGIRSVLKNVADKSVRIDLSVDIDGNGTWVKVLSSVDNGTNFGGPAITSSGHAGIRTDFMDVEFRNYKIQELN